MLPFIGINRVTSPFGPRNGKQHNGIDIVGDTNPAVLAVASGTVHTSTIITDKSNRTWEWGNYVRIDLPNGERHYYCHLASRAVGKGQVVNVGTVLGIMGSTGVSTGPHLHFEVRNKSDESIDPAPTLGIPNQVDVYSNAYAGNEGGNETNPTPTPSPDYTAQLADALAEEQALLSQISAKNNEKALAQADYTAALTYKEAETGKLRTAEKDLKATDPLLKKKADSFISGFKTVSQEAWTRLVDSQTNL